MYISQNLTLSFSFKNHFRSSNLITSSWSSVSIDCYLLLPVLLFRDADYDGLRFHLTVVFYLPACIVQDNGFTDLLTYLIVYFDHMIASPQVNEFDRLPNMKSSVKIKKLNIFGKKAWGAWLLDYLITCPNRQK